MRNTLSFILAAILVSLISCSKDEDKNNTQKSIFKADIDGVTLDFGDTSDNFFADATLWDGKRLTISSFGKDQNLSLTIGETFIEERIQEGLYKIGTLQDNLESNILFFDPNDTNGGNGTLYQGKYACNVISSDQVGEINITKLDTENNIVSGTFAGSLFRWIDAFTGDLKTIEVTNGVFIIPYIERNGESNTNNLLISARVKGYRFMSYEENSPDSRRSLSSGIDKIEILGYDHNFGEIQISMPSTVKSGDSYSFRPNGSFQSLGATFQNRINIPEILTSNNPNQSNDSYISIISHDTIANSIEGNLYTENEEIEGRAIVDGYFKTIYIDEVEN